MSGCELGADCTTRVGEVIQERAPMRTLVVDDTPDLLEVICTFLEMDDRIELIGRATNGIEALDAVASFRPDLVVMDVHMPKMDGFTAAALIRLNFPEVSIVLMSASPSQFIGNQIRASQADAFIDKLDFWEIFSRVLARLTTVGQMRV